MAFSFSLEVLVVSVFLLKTGLSGMTNSCGTCSSKLMVKLDQES